MRIKKMPLSKLHPAEENVRSHPQKQIKEYVRSIKMFGQTKPLVIDENGEILIGNGLYLAFTEMGADSCDCYVIEGLTENQKKKLMLSDNRVYELGLTNVSTFEQIVQELDGDIDVPGWDAELIQMLNESSAEIDKVITDYGNFSAEDTARIINNQEKREAQAERPPEPEYIKPAETQRYIICPNCGEKICI